MLTKHKKVVNYLTLSNHGKTQALKVETSLPLERGSCESDLEYKYVLIYNENWGECYFLSWWLCELGQEACNLLLQHKISFVWKNTFTFASTPPTLVRVTQKES